MMRETSCFSLSQVAVDKTQKTQQLLLTKAPNCLRFASSTINPLQFPFKKSGSPTKSFIFKFFERLLLNNGDGIQNYTQNLNIWTVLGRQTRRRTLQQNIAIFPKPDCILLMLTRNQLPSIVSEGNGGRSHGDGTRRKLVGQFPSSVAIILLTTEICGNFLKCCCPTGNIRETC